jgi:hypothetical protein
MQNPYFILTMFEQAFRRLDEKSSLKKQKTTELLQ